MASTADFRNGFVLEFKNGLYTIVEFQHVKPGKGGAFVRTKLKNVSTGAVIDYTFRAGESITEVRLERRRFQYLYAEGDLYYCMDNETYEQIPVNGAAFGGGTDLLQENMDVTLLMKEERVLLAELPNFIEAEITETDPGVRGDTVSGATKPASIGSGATVNVPLFLNVGDRIRIDTRTRGYMERVSS